MSHGRLQLKHDRKDFKVYAAFAKNENKQYLLDSE